MGSLLSFFSGKKQKSRRMIAGKRRAVGVRALYAQEFSGASLFFGVGVLKTHALLVWIVLVSGS